MHMPTDAGLGVERGHNGQDVTVTILDEAAIRAVFERQRPLTIGIEEEVLLLDPVSLLPVPAADDVVALAGEQSRIKRELPACQVELVTAVHGDAASAVEDLRRARAELLAICEGEVAVAAAAVHPTAAAEAITALGGRHGEIEATYGMVARRQLVGALQVHVALGSADRTLRVYNALRSHLPLLAALAASAPFHEGRDTGLASVRPLIAGQLPRQGVPPRLESWSAFAADMAWGARSGVVSEPRRWWWELRPHVVHGTIEVRVPDVQADPLAMTAVVRTVHALVAHLAAQDEAERLVEAAPTWRIAENRWAALRDGIHGTQHDLVSGASTPTARRLHELLDSIEPCAPGGLDVARALVERNGADCLRDVGLDGASRWLVDSYRA